MPEGWNHSLQFQGEQFVLGEGEITVGRSRTCDVTISDPSVSRRHVILVPGAGHIVVRDLGSSNGTFINERRVQAEDVVENGDVLRMGDAEVQVTVDNPALFKTARLSPQQSLPQPGEATFFLQAESMKLAEAMESGDESPAGPSAAEFKMPATPESPPATPPPATPDLPPAPDPAASPSAMPIPPPATSSPSAMPVPPPATPATSSPSAMPVPPPATPTSPDSSGPSAGLDTQRLDVHSLGFGPGPEPAADANPATTQRLPSLGHLSAPPATPGAPPESPPTAAPAETQRIEMSDVAPEPPPSAETQRLDINSLGFGQGDADSGMSTQRLDLGAGMQTTAMTPEQLQGLQGASPADAMQTTAMTPEQLAALRVEPAQQVSEPVSPAPMQTTAMTAEQIKALQEEAASPAPVPPAASPPSMQTTAMTPEQIRQLTEAAGAPAAAPTSPEPVAPQPDAPPEPAASQPTAGTPPAEEKPPEPKKPTTAEELMAMNSRPKVTAYSADGSAGATAIEIPSVPDIDVASEQSILSMPVAPVAPEADGEMPAVPDINVSSEQSIVGMAVAPMEPEFHAEAPVVPDIAIDEEEEDLPSAPAPVLSSLESLAGTSEPSSPPEPPAEPAPASFEDSPSFDAGPGFDAPSFDAPSFDAGPSFDAAPSFDADPGFDAAPSFEPAGPDPGGDSLSFGDLDASSKFEVKKDRVEPPAAPIAAEPAAPSFDLPAPAAEPAASVPAFEPPDHRPPAPVEPPPLDSFVPAAPTATPSAAEVFDAPLPETEADGGAGAFAAPAPEFFTPEAPAAEAPFGDQAAAPAATPVLPSFDQVTPPAAPPQSAPPPSGFAQPTPAAAPPPENQEVLERQPVGSLLPSLDDITASVGPPEMRPPQQPAVETDAFAMPPVQPTAQMPTGGQLVPAGAGIRLVAYLIDAIVFGGLSYAVQITGAGGLLLLLAGLIGPVAIFLGWTLAGTSPGKWACRLVIRDQEGNNKLGPAKAVLRMLGYILSGFTLGLAFLSVPFSKDKRGLHDKIAGTTVYRA